MDGITITTPYQSALPSLSEQEFDLLKASVLTDGVRDACIATEDGRLLDGHHRLTVCPDAPVRCLPGSANWSDEVCIAWIFRNAEGRRNTTAEQRQAMQQEKRRLAALLRQQGLSQEAIGEMLGVAQRTVCDWLTTISGVANCCETQDNRRVISRDDWPAIAERIAAGETQQQVANDYGVSQQAIARILRKLKQAEKPTEDASPAEQPEEADIPITVSANATPFTYASLCSGIEGASVAWQTFGWQPLWFAEIDPFCCRLLEQHHPDVPNLGDVGAISAAAIKAKLGDQRWTSLSPEPRASRSRLTVCDWVWLMSVASWPLNFCESFGTANPVGSSGKTWQECCQSTEDGRLAPSSGGWLNAGMGGPTGSLTLATSECPSAVAESSLWDIVEGTVADPPMPYLTVQQLSTMRERLIRYKGEIPKKIAPLFGGGQETQPPSLGKT